MSSAKGTPTPSFRNTASAGKQSLLPPKSPFPTVLPSYADYGIAGHGMGPKGGVVGGDGVPRPREGQRHQRTTSESFLVEDQPSWLDDLLNEPETPLRRGAHRRSSSDSFAYLDAASAYSNVESQALDGYPQRALASAPSWGSEDFDCLRVGKAPSFSSEGNSFARPDNRLWESTLSSVNYHSSIPLHQEKSIHTGQSIAKNESDASASGSAKKQDGEDSFQDPNSHQVKNSQCEGDQKRTKQQFAQRSRVRKLQYIAELEKIVQALQVQKSQVSSDLKFLDEHNFFLNYENKNLKQKLESLQREQVMKCLQHDMLERELARLRSLYHQQQQPHAPSHSRSSSRDLDLQFSNLSLNHSEANPRRDPFTGPLRI